jgi:septal ring-binding cell division protein DamX
MHNDEGFREIQLNGKQLVFLFMAATVVLVVTFLFGLLVGRGAPGRTETAGTPGEVVADRAVAPLPENPPPAAPATGTQAANKAEPGAEELSYAERLLRDTPPEEKLKPSARATPEPAPPAPAVQEPVAAQPPPPRPAATPPAPAPARTASSGPQPSDPRGPGFAVQVSISETRKEADQLASQLIAKGYPAFVVDPVKGTPKQIYRIRVGKYKTRRDAEEVLGRLEKNEHFKPWIAR